MRCKLQPYVMQAATVCNGGRDRLCWRPRPYGMASPPTRRAFAVPPRGRGSAWRVYGGARHAQQLVVGDEARLVFVHDPEEREPRARLSRWVRVRARLSMRAFPWLSIRVRGEPAQPDSYVCARACRGRRSRGVRCSTPDAR